METTHSAFDKMLDGLDWREWPSANGESCGLPLVTHKGILKIGDKGLTCYRLNDGRKIFDADDVHEFFKDYL